MNGVIGMTDLLLDTVLDAEQREYLGIVKSSADALLRVINDILDFSKIEAGKLLIENIPFNLANAIADTMKSVALRANEKGLELVFDIAPDVPLAVLGDPGRLRQVIVNIVGNAIKFTEKGEIVVRIALAEAVGDGAMLHISVSDSGIGIPAAKLGSVFDAFSQEDSSITRKYGGTGLGLTICSRLVAAMGGQIWVESEVGKGSVFHFTMHVGLDHSVPMAAQPIVRFAGLRVLIVDDNAVNRLVLARSLEAEQCIVHGVSSGAEALQWLAQDSGNLPPCDIVLLDAQMPEMDGFAVAQRILRLPRCASLPMVMLSSAGMKGDAQRASEAGILGYLTKPIARDELLQILARILNVSPAQPHPLVTSHSLREEQVLMNVLLVEDHLINQKLAITLLERWGHHVEVAGNGQIALEMVANQQFDVILMDMMMPVMDGLEATRRIRASETTRRTPIIAMTANAMEADRERCLQVGMDDYLSKPIKAPELRQMLQHFSSAKALVSQTRPSPLVVAAPPIPAFDYATALKSADQEVIEIISEAFVDQWPDELKKIHDGLSSGDLATVMHTAHALKGTLSMFGAAPASALAAQMEQCALRKDAQGVSSLVAPLSQALATLIAVLVENRTQ
jgi:CheY-like chemotaxis protein/HPt (histidine-containing phosphotransfer) domain-containing protein